MDRSVLSRRKFLRNTAVATAAAVAFPTIIPSSARGAGAVAPSNRIVFGTIGCGGQGMGNTGNFLGQSDAQVVAVCDPDGNHLQSAKQAVDRRYGNQDCKAYKDFRELLARRDIDAIVLATPDHWHALIGIWAARSGKDIYGEKPLTHDLREGRALCDAVHQNGRVWQTGSQQRSDREFRQACEIARNGLLGKIHTVEVGLPTGSAGGSEKFTDPPAHLDYDYWIGPAPWAPYSPQRTHWDWRWQLDYGGGQLMDWIGHHGDIAQWGLGTDHTGPVEFDGKGVFPKEGLFNAATTYRCDCKYANGVHLVIASDSGHGIRHGTKFIGDKGWVWATRGAIDAEPKSILKEKFGPSDINLYRTPGHHRNFLDCVKSRKLTICPVETGHRSASLGHLSLISMLVGRKIRWNPQTEQIIDDPGASALLGRAKREPWDLL